MCPNARAELAETRHKRIRNIEKECVEFVDHLACPWRSPEGYLHVATWLVNVLLDSIGSALLGEEATVPSTRCHRRAPGTRGTVCAHSAQPARIFCVR